MRPCWASWRCRSRHTLPWAFWRGQRLRAPWTPCSFRVLCTGGSLTVIAHDLASHVHYIIVPDVNITCYLHYRLLTGPIVDGFSPFWSSNQHVELLFFCQSGFGTGPSISSYASCLMRQVHQICQRFGTWEDMEERQTGNHRALSALSMGEPGRTSGDRNITKSLGAFDVLLQASSI